MLNCTLFKMVGHNRTLFSLFSMVTSAYTLVICLIKITQSITWLLQQSEIAWQKVAQLLIAKSTLCCQSTRESMWLILLHEIQRFDYELLLACRRFHIIPLGSLSLLVNIFTNTVGPVQIQRNTSHWYWAEYSTFYISDEVNKYKLTLAGYSGDAGDALAGSMSPAGWDANSRSFSTVDNDNDQCEHYVCAAEGGGWWYSCCTSNALNLNVEATWTIGDYVRDVIASHLLVKLI